MMNIYLFVALVVAARGPSDQITSAIYEADLGKVRALVEQFPQAIEQTNSVGRTPLDQAAGVCNREIVHFLLSKGARVDSRSLNGTPPLMTAIGCEVTDDINNPLRKAFDRVGTIKELLSAGANVNLSTTNGTTPLHAACVRGDETIVAMLIGAKANVNARDKLGISSLDNALLLGRAHVVKELLLIGADVDVFNAAALGREDQVQKFLAESKNNINARNAHGETLLHYAARYGQETIVRILLTKGARADVEAEGGTTPVDWAAANGHTQILDLFKAHGVDVEKLLREGIAQ